MEIFHFYLVTQNELTGRHPPFPKDTCKHEVPRVLKLAWLFSSQSAALLRNYTHKAVQFLVY